MTSTFHLHYTVVVNSDLVNCKKFQVEKVNMQNITNKQREASEKHFKAATRQSMVLPLFNIFSFY